MRGPSTPTEALVAGVWGELLDLDTVPVDENFFVLGGHSLLALQVVERLAEQTATPLELEDFIDLGTVEEVAAELDRRVARAAATDEEQAYEGEL